MKYITWSFLHLLMAKAIVFCKANGNSIYHIHAPLSDDVHEGYFLFFHGYSIVLIKF
mgnify:CR=1 FL=1